MAELAIGKEYFRRQKQISNQEDCTGDGDILTISVP